eukprot:GHVN01032674.1.p1 GENE.GHVN01032674.1~~GHVN01032674.1.p1  ORF type:complete len:188 (-),score=21.39 GHVN01032674.1:69-632(-)
MMKAMHFVLCEEHQGNLIYSPWSIDFALGMVLLGAKGATRDQLVAAGIDDDHKQRGSLIANLKGSKQFTLSVAARLFTEQSRPLLMQYSTDSEAAYNTAAYPLDFGNEPAKACSFINEWVAQNTNNKIIQLLPSVPAETVMVLCNAISFKGCGKESSTLLKLTNVRLRQQMAKRSRLISWRRQGKWI